MTAVEDLPSWKLIAGMQFGMFQIDEIAEAMEGRGGDIIRLTLGKTQERLHPEILAAYEDAVRDPDKRNLVYPQGLPALRDGVARWYTQMGNEISPESVFVGTGTSQLIKDLFRLVANQGEVLLPCPYYSVYSMSAVLADARISHYSIEPSTGQIDLASFARNFRRGKTNLVVVNSPGNPLGNVLSKSELVSILEIVDGDAYILSDEIYRNAAFYGPPTSVLDVARPGDRIVVSNAFSKAFRMYTARVGFLVVQETLAHVFRAVLQHTLLTANPSAQFACVEALSHLEEVDAIVALHRRSAQASAERLAGLPDVQVCPAAGGFYFVLRCADYMHRKGYSSSLDLAKDLLCETGVAVVPGSDFGIPFALRVSFTDARFSEGVERIRRFFLRP